MGMFWKIAAWCFLIQYFLPTPVSAYFPWIGGTTDNSQRPDIIGGSCKSDDPGCTLPPGTRRIDDVTPPPPPSWFSFDFLLGNLSIYSLIITLSSAGLALVALWVYTLNALCLVPIRLVRKYLIRHGTIDTGSHNILRNMRKQLEDTEKDRDKFKSDLEDLSRRIGNMDGTSLDEAGSPPRNDSRSCLSQATAASNVSSMKYDTKADYVRKCRYLARKLKDSETRAETMRGQVELATEIKAEFDALSEQRSALGRQTVSLTREKREARQRTATLQTEVRAAKKQLDLSGEQNGFLIKQAEVLNLNLKIAVRDKKTVRKQLKEVTEEAESIRQELKRVHEENHTLVMKSQEYKVRNSGELDNGAEKGPGKIQILEKNVIKDNVSKVISFKKEVDKTGETPKKRPIVSAEKDFVGHDSIPCSSSTSRETESQNIEQSLLNLERSVEKNLKLRKYAKSLITGSSSDIHTDNTAVDTEKVELTAATDCENATHPSTRTSLADSGTSDGQVTTSGLPVNPTAATDNTPSPPSCVSDLSYQDSVDFGGGGSLGRTSSICCLDSCCSVCSLPDCTLLHVSCSDLHCVAAMSSCSLRSGVGGGGGGGGGGGSPSRASSICCLDSRCSVCSLPGCTLRHVSCSDLHCVTTLSSCSLPSGGRGGGGGRGGVVDRQESRTSVLRQQADRGGNGGGYARQPSAHRMFGTERLADIFGNGQRGEECEWSLSGSALRLRSIPGSVVVNPGSPVAGSFLGEEGDRLSSSSDFGSSRSSAASFASSTAFCSAEVDKKQVSCFTRNEDGAVAAVARGVTEKSAAFKQFLKEMTGGGGVGADDPGLGDEDPITDEEDKDLAGPDRRRGEHCSGI